MNTHYDDGKSNKVGSLKGEGGHADTGSTAEKLTHTVNDGKNNKVGSVNPGPAFGDVKVEPMKKASK